MAPKKKKNTNGSKSSRKSRSDTSTDTQKTDFINFEKKPNLKNFGKYRSLLENPEEAQSIDCPEHNESENIDFEELISVSCINSSGLKMDDQFTDPAIHITEIRAKADADCLATDISSQLSNLVVTGDTKHVDRDVGVKCEMDATQIELSDHIFNDNAQTFTGECVPAEIIPVASEQEVESEVVIEFAPSTGIKDETSENMKSEKKPKSKSRSSKSSKSSRSRSTARKKSSSTPKLESKPKKEASSKPRAKKTDKELMDVLMSLDNSIRRSSRIKSICEKQTQNKNEGKGGKGSTDSDLSENGQADDNIPTDGSNPPNPVVESEAEVKPVKVKSRWRRSSELEMEVEADKVLSSAEEIKGRLKQFIHLKENQYLTGRVTCKEARKMVCDCMLTNEEIEKGEVGCGEDCLNRLLLIECGTLCPVGDKCTNKRFQKSAFSPCEVFRTDKKGLGIRATAAIPFGEFILEYVGEVIGPDEFEDRATEYSKDKNPHYYFMSLRSDAVIDATQKGNISRFINHSCDPNAETQKWTVNGELRIGFFSKRTIIAGEEITFDYQFQRYGKEAQKCFCESSLCRGWLGEEPDDDDDDDEEEEEEEEEDEEEVEKVVREVVPEVTKAEEEQPPLPPEPPVIVPATEPVVELPPPVTPTLVPEPIIKVETPEPIPSKTPPVVTPAEIQLPVKVQTPARKEKKKIIKRKILKDLFEDVDVDEELELLVSTGLKNRAQTVKLCRLMVRATEVSQRTTLLRVLRRGEFPCRRLFLDYHGLQLIYGWMSDAQQLCSTNEKQEALRLGILQTLATLPIPDKTMLQDSKVLPTVELWSKKLVNIPKEFDSESNSPMLDNEAAPICEPKAEITIQSDPTETWKNDEVIKEEDKLEEDEKMVFKRPVDMYEIRRSVGMDIENIRSENLWRVEEDNVKLVQEIIDMFEEDMDISTMVFNSETKVAEVQKDRPKEDERDYEGEIISLALELLKTWSVLKEVFRIPKKERVEKMKEHEREADKGYKGDSEHHSEREREREKEKERHRRQKFREQKRKSRKSQKHEDSYHGMHSRINKHERRKLFAMQVEQEEERRYKREIWRQHDIPYMSVGNDSMYSSQYEPSRNFQMIWNQQNGQWQNYPVHLNANPIITSNLTPGFNIGLNYSYSMPGTVPNISVSLPNLPMPSVTMSNPMINPQITSIPPPMPAISNMSVPPPNISHMQQNIHRPLIPHTMPAIPNVPTLNIPTNIPPPSLPRIIPQATSISLPENITLQTNIPPPTNVTPISNLQSQSLSMQPTNIPPPNISQHVFNSEKQPEKEIQVKFAGPIPPPAKLPPKWKCAKDKYGRPYYYHIKIRISQWEPPEIPPHLELDEESTESSSSSETSSLSSDSSSEDSDEDDLEESKLAASVRKKHSLLDSLDKCSPQIELSPNDSCTITNEEEEMLDTSVTSLDERLQEEFNVLKRECSTNRESASKRKRLGLVTEVHIISPRTEEDKVLAKENLRKYKENKERLKRQKETSAEQTKKRVKVTIKTPKSSRKHKTLTKIQLKEAMDLNSESARKIKESFTSIMAGVMVGILNPYRKADCKEGKITNTEDFKHLARKLTHFVMIKELKHCQNLEDLTCTESVKSKAKEFVRKYMSKFGELYVRPPDDLDY
ncbi:histone-lysine N-methyltransferase SETD2-like isoform X2 [Photinus pyralis]|nr:histone-lysine N-methyltransferase SETD2-like isoform X2 [Photinus pyralis]XP_031343382.1 histone-lysine N-methyltransferase SETD2-like isoform X2 [Photinus pyralis]